MQNGVEMTPVGQPGQGIGGGLAPGLLERLFQRRNPASGQRQLRADLRIACRHPADLGDQVLHQVRQVPAPAGNGPGGILQRPPEPQHLPLRGLHDPGDVAQRLLHLLQGVAQRALLPRGGQEGTVQIVQHRVIDGPAVGVQDRHRARQVRAQPGEVLVPDREMIGVGADAELCQRGERCLGKAGSLRVGFQIGHERSEAKLEPEGPGAAATSPPAAMSAPER